MVLEDETSLHSLDTESIRRVVWKEIMYCTIVDFARKQHWDEVPLDVFAVGAFGMVMYVACEILRIGEDFNYSVTDRNNPWMTHAGPGVEGGRVTLGSD